MTLPAEFFELMVDVPSSCHRQNKWKLCRHCSSVFQLARVMFMSQSAGGYIPGYIGTRSIYPRTPINPSHKLPHTLISLSPSPSLD